MVKEQLSGVPEANILAESIRRNTAVVIIQQKYKDVIMMVLGSDHLIKNDQSYLDNMILAFEVADRIPT